jgi:hypothetical protein
MARVTAGRLNKQVAGALEISEITVKAHRGKVMRKMSARSFAALVEMAARLRACVLVRFPIDPPATPSHRFAPGPIGNVLTLMERCDSGVPAIVRMYQQPDEGAPWSRWSARRRPES